MDNHKNADKKKRRRVGENMLPSWRKPISSYIVLVVAAPSMITT